MVTQFLVLYCRTLIRIFPNAKVVLTTRDPEKWYASITSTIYKQQKEVETWVISLFLKLICMEREFDVAIRSNQQKIPGSSLGKRVYLISYEMTSYIYETMKYLSNHFKS